MKTLLMLGLIAAASPVAAESQCGSFVELAKQVMVARQEGERHPHKATNLMEQHMMVNAWHQAGHRLPEWRQRKIQNFVDEWHQVCMSGAYN